jgi:hypothetical protein
MRSVPLRTWLQRVLDLAADGRVEGGELGALLDLLPALDRGHAAAVALTDTALQGSLPERKAGINYDTLLAMQTRATYTERGRLQRLAQLLRKTPNLRAAYHHGLIGTGQLHTIATEAKVLRGDALAAFDACFADTDKLARLEPDRLIDLARIEIDRLRPDLAQRRETRTVERSYLHLQPCLDGSGEGHFAYDADSFASLVAAIDTAAGPPTTDSQDRASGNGSAGDRDADADWFDPVPDRPRAHQRADGLLALCEAFLAGNLTTHDRDAADDSASSDADGHTANGAGAGTNGHRAGAGASRHRQRRGHGAGTASAGATEVAVTGGGSLVEAVTTRQLTEQPDPRPRRVRRALRGGRPRTRAVVVVDIAHLTGDDDSPAARAARLLWRLHGAPPALTTAGVRRLCDDADLQLLLTDGHTILGITAPTPTIPTRLREAVYARDQGCRFAGCRAPVAWCDLHHVIAREDGGHTIITNLVALCRRHHTAITTGRWTLSMTDDGTVTLRRGRIVHTTDPPLHLTLAPD